MQVCGKYILINKRQLYLVGNEKLTDIGTDLFPVLIMFKFNDFGSSEKVRMHKISLSQYNVKCLKMTVYTGTNTTQLLCMIDKQMSVAIIQKL